MDARLEVYHHEPFGPLEICPVPTYIIELVLVFGCLLICQDYILADIVGLTRLDAWEKEKGHHRAWLPTQQNWANNSLGQQLIQVDI